MTDKTDDGRADEFIEVSYPFAMDMGWIPAPDMFDIHWKFGPFIKRKFCSESTYRRRNEEIFERFVSNHELRLVKIPRAMLSEGKKQK